MEFVSTRAFYSCFEYRTDGDLTQKIDDTNFNSEITDGLYPFFCVNNQVRVETITALEYVEVRMVFGAETDERFDWTRFDVIPPPLQKRLTSGPCLDDPTEHCEVGVYQAEEFTFSGTGRATGYLAGFNEGGASWQCPSVSASAALTSAGFEVFWEGLFIALGCTNPYQDWFGVLACDDTIIAQTEALPSDLNGDGSAAATGTVADFYAWIAAAQNCSGDLLFLLVSSQTCCDDEWVAYAPAGVPEIAIVVETVKAETTPYDFIIVMDPLDEEPYDVIDTFPAEWLVTAVNGESVFNDTTLPLECGEQLSVDDWMLSRGGKVGKNCQSDTDLIWTPPPGETAVIHFDVETRPSPGTKPGKEPKFAPTGCGGYYLNYGAESTSGFYSNSLCIAAVEDFEPEGIDYSGNGDEDGDTLLDYEEACELGTDPCDTDSDDDGVDDGFDNCPLEGPADPELGEILDPDGCIRQSQCSDNEDNDSDQVSDYPDDPSCKNIIDDEENNPDEDDDGVLDGLDQCPLDGDAGDGVDTNGCPNVTCRLTQYFGTLSEPIYWDLVIGPTTNDVGGGVWGRSIPEGGPWPLSGSYDGTNLDITGTNPAGDEFDCDPPSQAETINDKGTCNELGVCIGTYTRFCSSGDSTREIIAPPSVDGKSSATFNDGACILTTN
ncbi:hypothetical protein ACFL07_00960 [Pseudomonadota bacterium]